MQPEAFAASQIDWEQLAVDGGPRWEAMARAAFDALDLDGDGQLQRSELELMLLGRCEFEVRLHQNDRVVCLWWGCADVNQRVLRVDCDL